MSFESLEIQKRFEAFKERALDNNSKSLATWTKYKTELDETKSLLALLPKKVSHSVMVPLGPRALVPGTIVHTNEFLVNLGDNWFVKRSACETEQICDRRIRTCDEMIQKFEKEKEMLDYKSAILAEQEAFGGEERPEIIEYVTEEEHTDWKEQHRMKEKKYHEKLSELRKKKREPIKTEEDLWNRLDELQLQEELEDELNRLGDGMSDEEDDSGVLSKSTVESSLRPEKTPSVHLNSTEELCDKGKRKVSFACDVDDPLRLEITHSDVEPGPSYSTKKEIISPSDIYEEFLTSSDRHLTSVIKTPEKTKSVNYEERKHNESPDYCESEKIFQVVVVKDIKEKNSSEENSVNDLEEMEGTSKKMSKFKKLKSKKSEM